MKDISRSNYFKNFVIRMNYSHETNVNYLHEMIVNNSHEMIVN